MSIGKIKQNTYVFISLYLFPLFTFFYLFYIPRAQGKVLVFGQSFIQVSINSFTQSIVLSFILCSCDFVKNLILLLGNMGFILTFRPLPHKVCDFTCCKS